ncbi:hypothetical protein KBK19_14410 [Microvirga sp. STR05]|uniref:Uncharacterized protein n=1 Tax=Hymenobacter duratus TaxID=2771356 RepID=A0ABR8JKJ0_9BACT|nr:hypothetical protein [Hymenobacter duratus]MBD2716231.1 hypothetical protein [Hymenobacter duratus]MBR7951145.1 hypothetical protein [Microvirga sp. STR05]
MMLSIRPLGRLLLAAVLLTATLPACETTKKGFPEMNSPNGESDEAARRKREPASKLIASVGERGLIKYVLPREQLAQAFNRQFSDGTSIDKTMVRKVQGKPKDPAVYYVVGLGLRNGMFRGMALPLTLSGSELYLSSNASRYVISGVGCTFCFFNFENNDIVGTSCEENTGGSRCDLRVEDNNTLFTPR